MMNIDIPANLYMILSLIEGPLQYQWFNSQEVISVMFGIDQSLDRPYYNEIFNEFGFNNNLVLDNLQTSFIYLLLLPFTLIIDFLLYKLEGHLR